MDIRFDLPRGYVARYVRLCLTRTLDGKRWEFRGLSDDSYSVPARNKLSGVLLPTFRTRDAAHTWAAGVGLPRYMVWSGHGRTYRGLPSAHRQLAEERA